MASQHYGVLRLHRCHGCLSRKFRSRFGQRFLHHDGRNRLSNFWTPISQQQQEPAVDRDGHEWLLRAGFLRQAQSGIFHLLPLGLRVLDKVERLIDKHMQSISASKVSLSSISSQKLWERSGRLDRRNAELFFLEDRKKGKYLLAPTHEEEITTVVKGFVQSYKDLPLRLYQVSRKYRDEARPRQGLLRGREFIMKDLYTFDGTEEQAMKTYEQVRAAYRAFLDEFNLPYVVADADSGNMGGTHSHEYHFVSPNGEDTIISCRNCSLSVNEELYLGRYDPERVDNTLGSLLDRGSSQGRVPDNEAPFSSWIGRLAKPLTYTKRLGEMKTRGQPSVYESTGNGDSEVTAFVHICYPRGPFEINIHALRKLIPNLDTTTNLNDFGQFQKQIQDSKDVEWLVFRDPRVTKEAITGSLHYWQKLAIDPPQNIKVTPFHLTKARPDDICPGCAAKGTLSFRKAVEIGHTFHLGTRYSKPLGATIKTDSNQLVDIEMGCHGIGVSRLIGAVATLLADRKGLNWPIAMAPFGVVLVGTGKTSNDDVSKMYDLLSQSLAEIGTDVVIDDREKHPGWKLNDADLVGYPFIVVLGQAWNQQRAVELQCRRLCVKKEVVLGELVQQIETYSKKL